MSDTQQYRLLELGELIQEGDEYEIGVDVWEACMFSIGELHSTDHQKTRRPIPQPELIPIYKHEYTRLLKAEQKLAVAVEALTRVLNNHNGAYGTFAQNTLDKINNL